MNQPSFEDIELRAYQLWQQRGDAPGSAGEDWFQAEKELTGPDSVLIEVAQKVGTVLGTAVAFLDPRN